MKKTQHGVNLLELMIVIAILAIVAMIAIPSMQSIWQNSRAATLTTDFTSTLIFARSEAIKRGFPVTVCAAADTTYTTCGNNSSNWANGWITFLDSDGNGVIATSSDRLEIHNSLAGGATLTTTQVRITYQSSGFVSAGSGSFLLSASNCTGNSARRIDVGSTGRTSVTDSVCP